MKASTANWLGTALICLTLWPSAAAGQSPVLTDSYSRSVELFNRGQYDEAVTLALRAAELSEREFGPHSAYTGSVLNFLARIYRVQGRYADAERTLVRAIKDLETELGSSDPSLADAIHNLVD